MVHGVVMTGLSSAISPTMPAALIELQALLGHERCKLDLDTRRHYARSTSGHAAFPAGVVFPTSVKEVQRIVQQCAQAGMALYPISGGRNWGYGDATAPTAGQVIMDFARMNRIVEVNGPLGYAVIEPGVTQGQLSDYLKEHHPDLWMDSTGAGQGASLVGNALDRGFGHTRYGDHAGTFCGLEIVLGDGRILKTGYLGYENAQAARVYRYGVGPFLDGIFSQSNYGIITQMGLWLCPKPEAFSAFFLMAEKPGDLPGIIDRIAPLRMQGLLQSTIHIANDLRSISARRRYPWDLPGGKTPLPGEIRERLRKEIGIGAWNGAGAIYGNKAIVKATRKALSRALGPYKVRYLDDSKLALAGRVQRFLAKFGGGKKLAELLEIIRPVYALLKGEPNDDALRGATWRVRDPDPGVPIEPRDAHAGLLWISPVVPSTGRHATEVMGILEPIFAEHGFELLVTFTMITERAMCCVTNVAFDTRQAEEMAAAKRCYEAAMKALLAAGYVPYRSGPAGYEKLNEAGETFWYVARAIKGAMDPGGVIAPGRYGL